MAEEVRAAIRKTVADRLLVTEPEAARLLAISVSSFRRDILGKGHLKPVRLPGGTRRNLYSMAAIEQLVAEASAYA